MSSFLISRAYTFLAALPHEPSRTQLWSRANGMDSDHTMHCRTRLRTSYQRASVPVLPRALQSGRRSALGGCLLLCWLGCAILLGLVFWFHWNLLLVVAERRQKKKVALPLICSKYEISKCIKN